MLDDTLPRPTIISKIDATIVCIKCGYVLINPYMLSCGHRMCYRCIIETEGQQCIGDGDGECDMVITTLDMAPDNNVAKNISILEVMCYNEECYEQMQWIKLKQHVMEECQYRKIQCECGVDVLYINLRDHHKVCPLVIRKCDYHNIGCNITGTSAELAQHMHDGIDTHLQLIACDSLELQIREQKLLYRLGRTEEDIETLKNENIRKMIDAINKKIKLMEETMKGMTIQRLDEFRKLSKPIDDATARIKKLEQISVDLTKDHIVKIEKRVDELLKVIDDKMDAFNTRLMNLEYETFDGKLLWKLDNFIRHKKFARSSSNLSDQRFVSNPFYTERFGYKFAISVYPNGDGDGRGTHLSMFIFVMRTRHDDLLRWPIRAQVTFMVLHPERERIVYTFRADDPNNACYNKPTTEGNPAFGTPLLISHTDIENKYLINGALFLYVDVRMLYPAMF
jgi:hypothetical protein